MPGNWRLTFRIDGKDAVHASHDDDMIMRLEKPLGTSAASWLRVQEAVDLWQARQQPKRFATIKRLPASAVAG